MNCPNCEKPIANSIGSCPECGHIPEKQHTGTLWIPGLILAAMFAVGFLVWLLV